jgi:hypothetical protein
MRGLLKRVRGERLRLVWRVVHSVRVSNRTMAYLAKEMKMLVNDAQI